MADQLLCELYQTWKGFPNQENEVISDCLAALEKLIPTDSKNKLIEKSANSTLASELMLLMPLLSWHKFPYGNKGLAPGTKMVSIVGQDISALIQCSNININAIYLPPGGKIPQHAEESATIFQLISKTSGMKIGITNKHMKEVTETDILVMDPAQPKVFESPKNSPCILLWTKLVLGNGNFWYSNEKSKEEEKFFTPFDDSFTHETYLKYYSGLSPNYNTAIRSYGYFIPEKLADVLIRHAKFEKFVDEVSLIDFGCGDGLSGASLKSRGFSNMTGSDFCPDMLKMAEKRGVYKKTIIVDLLQPMPIEDNLYDCITCIGTTTVTEPVVLSEWIRICKPGGYIAFSHKDTVYSKYEPIQDQFEKEKLWKLIWISNPELYYLPSCPYLTNNKCKLYLYQKL